ncbi:LysR family transcriptional regulator [Ferrimonas marina]|uniref:DNA-binding transcriptional regulator, LysR family n=1 Tax=Ferrimonas marina TaxID=299255 RepID=A0A1M5RCA2_9GAMM|nr:LysR family transcriptional regulator [Ferrimonas marina]SHH23972.1 DNA-binding transcriptional regulator, LysR family [Ferrimonas marina]
MITLEQITCFQAVYQQGSYSAAARQLNKDRTTVREHILALEDTLNASVFEIEGKKAVPTELGHYLFPRASLLHKHAFEFMHSALSIQQSELAELTICYDAQVPRGLIASMGSTIAETFPYLRTHFLHRNRDESTRALEQSQAQLAFVMTAGGTYAPEQVGMLNLGSAEFRPYAHPSSNLCRPKPISLNELTSELQWVVENSLQSSLKTLNVSSTQHIVSNIDLLVDMLAQRGWSLLNCKDAQPYLAQERLKEIKLEQMSGSYQASVALFYDLGVEGNPVIQHLLKVIPALGREYLT